MTVLESMLVGVNGLAVVFTVLIVLSLIVTLQSKLVVVIENWHKGAQTIAAAPEVKAEAAPAPVVEEGPEVYVGELRLTDVDERTAAMCMAIVSDQSGIPLSQLIFKSIKVLD